MKFKTPKGSRRTGRRKQTKPAPCKPITVPADFKHFYIQIQVQDLYSSDFFFVLKFKLNLLNGQVLIIPVVPKEDTYSYFHGYLWPNTTGKQCKIICYTILLIWIIKVEFFTISISARSRRSHGSRSKISFEFFLVIHKVHNIGILCSF